MATEIQKSQSFEDRMKERIKDSIGDLITDEELSRLVTKGVDEVFFKAITVSDGWSSTKTTPPLIHTIVKELLESTIRKAVDMWISEHKEEVLKVVDTVIAEGMAKALFRTIDMKFQSDLVNLQCNIQNSLQRVSKGEIK